MRLPVTRFALMFAMWSLWARADWPARPIEVHEWGVSVFDWSGTTPDNPALPGFFYTDKSPGQPLSAPASRVKDQEADIGVRIRTKPVLYFYGPDTLQKKIKQNNRPIPIAVEVRFQDGGANAWWPQVNRFRTKAESEKATAPNLESWNRTRMDKYKSALGARVNAAEFEKVWKSQENRKFIANQPGRLKDFGGLPPFPDDERFQLIWDRLELTQKIGTNQLCTDGLTDSHWVKLARKVDCDFVSTGRETEKFLFYEGTTAEPPAIAVIPHFEFNPRTRDPGFLVCNVTDHPIYDLFVIHRNRAKGQLWAEYFPVVQPMRNRIQDPTSEQSRPHVILPAIPNFSEVPLNAFLDESEFRRRTQDQLAQVLKLNYPDSLGYYGELRNPALYQPATVEHRLFSQEVAAIQAIWDQEFFSQDGLTVLYREAPQYLDEAVPLKIYTDHEHYINLSRCSLVVNQGINLTHIRQVSQEINEALGKTQREARKLEASTRQGVLKCFEKNRLATFAQLEYAQRSGWHEALLPPLISELRSRMTRQR